METILLLIAMSLLSAANAQSNYGKEFYFGSMRNYLARTSNLFIYITTTSSTPVTYIVETSSTILHTGNITNTIYAQLSLPTSLVVFSNNYADRKKAIHLYSPDGGMLSVCVINYLSRAIGSYHAYATQDLQLNEYQYYAVSTGTLSTRSYSQALIVGIHDNTTVTITPTQSIIVPSDIQDPSSSNMTVTAGTTYTVVIHKMQTFLFGAINRDISGTSVVSNKLITFLTGHECGNVPANVPYCEHIEIQIPPTVGWGKEYLLASFIYLIKIQFYKIVASERQTTFYYTCGHGNVTTNVITNAGSVLELTAGQSDNCSLVSDKPILVVKLGSAYNISGIGDPVMSVMSPTNYYSNYAAYFFLPDTLLQSSTSYLFSSHSINIVSKSPVRIKADGIEQTDLAWSPIYDRNGIIGYNTRMSNGSLELAHYIESNDTMNILVYGFQYRTGYSYSTGVRNFCLDDNGGCEHICNFSICYCMPGYMLDSNGRNCTAIDPDECQINNGGCEHNCTNLIPSFECFCLPGFLLYNQYFCADINECSERNANCSQICINDLGSYHCECYSGYVLTSLGSCQAQNSTTQSNSPGIVEFHNSRILFIVLAIGSLFLAILAQITTCICCAFFAVSKRNKKKERKNVIIPLAPIENKQELDDEDIYSQITL